MKKSINATSLIGNKNHNPQIVTLENTLDDTFDVKGICSCGILFSTWTGVISNAYLEEYTDMARMDWECHIIEVANAYYMTTIKHIKI